MQVFAHFDCALSEVARHVPEWASAFVDVGCVGHVDDPAWRGTADVFDLLAHDCRCFVVDFLACLQDGEIDGFGDDCERARVCGGDADGLEVVALDLDGDAFVDHESDFCW